MAPTTGRRADLPAASLRIGPTACSAFSHSPKNRALASASPYSPFGGGSGGLRKSNDRRSGEMAPRSAETSFQTSFSSPSFAPVAPFFFLVSLRGTRRSLKSLCVVSAVGLSNFAPRLPHCFHLQPSASSMPLRTRVSFLLTRRNVVLVSKPSFSLSVLNILPRGYLVSLGRTNSKARIKRTETKKLLLESYLHRAYLVLSRRAAGVLAKCQK